MNKRAKPNGRSHSVPAGLLGFIKHFGDMEEVEAVTSGRFIPRSKGGSPSLHVQFYDESRRTFRLKVITEGYVSYPEIRVKQGAREKIGELIVGYTDLR